MKVVLGYHGGRTAAREYHAGLLPLGLGYLAAMLRRDGFATTLVNFTRLSSHETRRVLESERPSILGLSVFTHNRHESFRLAALAKALHPGCVIVVGGPHPTHLPEQILATYPGIDAVAIGEGEETLLEAACAVKEDRGLEAVAGLAVRTGDGSKRTAPRPLNADLDSLPWPSFAAPSIGVDERAQRGYILSSRGCPADCSFCDSPAFWGRKLRFHSPRRVVAELRDLRDRLGLLYASFRDDTFAIHRTRALELLDAVAGENLGILWDGQTRVNGVDPERLRRMMVAGCHHVQYGVESGSPRMLSLLAKGVSTDHVRRAAAMTRATGLGLSIYLISGAPGEAAAEARETEALVREVKPHDGLVSPLAIYPGTPLYLAMRARGEIDDDVFVSSRRPAILAREDQAAVALFLRYQRLLEAVGRRARYGPVDYDRWRREHGNAPPWLLREAESRLASGDRSGAVATLDELARAAPEHPWAHLLLARTHAELGNRARSRAHAAELRRLVPRSDEPDRVEEIPPARRPTPRHAGRGRVPGRSHALVR